MKDNSTPATKADMNRLLEEFRNGFQTVNERIDGLDERFGRLDQRVSGLDERFGRLDQRVSGLDERVTRLGERLDGLDHKLGQFREETAQELEKIDRQLRVLVENTHRDLGDASDDAKQLLRDKYDRLEGRVGRLEKAVGLAA